METLKGVACGSQNIINIVKIGLCSTSRLHWQLELSNLNAHCRTVRVWWCDWLWIGYPDNLATNFSSVEILMSFFGPTIRLRGEKLRSNVLAMINAWLSQDMACKKRIEVQLNISKSSCAFCLRLYALDKSESILILPYLIRMHWKDEAKEIKGPGLPWMTFCCLPLEKASYRRIITFSIPQSTTRSDLSWLMLISHWLSSNFITRLKNYWRL